MPNDPVMLLSYINTMLRDNYSSLDELSSSMGVDAEEISSRLEAIGYSYDAQQNRFI
ncbi:MAG: DUF4250 domain-containing protein [Clostridiales bacterium]|nr:DUF4250 domain-containing protein [Clostridiales bacterium]